MAKAAYLRVYVPVSGSDGPVLEHIAERTAAPRVLRQGEFGLSTESIRDDAFVIDDAGDRYVCPRNPRLRMLEGLMAFRSAYSDSAASSLVPESVAERAAIELDRIHDRFPGVKSHILTAPFAIPLRWFSLFDQTDRIVEETGDHLSIRFRTPMVLGLDRVRRAAEVIDEAGFDDAIVEQVSDLISWLEVFPSDSIIELDYGGVVEFFDETDLVLDESVAEIAASLEALARGDYEAAGEAYATVASRWAHAHALTYAN
jgi:hypothetical protein